MIGAGHRIQLAGDVDAAGLQCEVEKGYQNIHLGFQLYLKGWVDTDQALS